ncbi:GNAT family N-acetyltransferase [Rugamonas rubra]|uniref:Ribosomal-protein-alanine N-acetyltransferase n=1 Tax=Rugamonas rubra TaxID=758825 RepID=A0A1I4U4W1_9BURK|nr:GNAT family protein [Rugamonas rubra]SFM83949.1 ribosomal-protein-alanine N-acetyltransferase [Rugamonas rubra]
MVLIENDSIQLRPIAATDRPYIQAGLSDAAVLRYYGMRFDAPDAFEVQMDWYRSIQKTGSGLWLAVVDASNGAFLGALGFSDLCETDHHAQLGYWLLPAHWGRGAMRAALQAFVPYVFAHYRINRLWAEVETENIASLELLRSLRFTEEGIHRECEHRDGRYISVAHFSLLRRELGNALL